MNSTKDSPDKQVEELMPRLSLGGILGSTVLALLVSVVAEGGLLTVNRTLIIATIFLVIFANLLLARLVVLPSIAREAEMPRSKLFTVGYSEAMSCGAVGLVTAILVGAWWVALVFGVMGLIFWLVVRDYLENLPIARGQMQF